ncbi:uncharacterized protein LOC130727866 [Lotus japonicus]|uniref:uncharacterized protein LOC130727866 n=1 Tax=Lotus japonicus TaxID=34305 RepID=UPI0025841CAE|nr:uncharacterized protein LOC130727866 [Lotus japonicus]
MFKTFLQGHACCIDGCSYYAAFTLASFFERYKNLDLARNFQFPTLRQNSLETKIEKSRKKLKEINNRAKKICGVNKQNMSTHIGVKEKINSSLRLCLHTHSTLFMIGALIQGTA